MGAEFSHPFEVTAASWATGNPQRSRQWGQPESFGRLDLAMGPVVEGPMFLRGHPQVGICTIRVGKKEIGRQAHFGVVRAPSIDVRVWWN